MTTPVSHNRLLKLGLLSDLQQRRKELQDRAEGILRSINYATFVSDNDAIFLLDTDKVKNYAFELHEVSDQGRRIEKQIADLKAELGI